MPKGVCFSMKEIKMYSGIIMQVLIYNSLIILYYYYTVKPVNKGHPREGQHMVFIDKWPLFGGYTVLINQGRITEVWPF